MRHPFAQMLGVEGLEHRTMMAGNITAAQVGADLIIDGDELDNNLTIENTAANEYQLIGGAAGGPSDTTINGASLFSGITGNIIVRLRGGNDHVDIGNGSAMAVGKALVVDVGDGNDTVGVGSFIAGSNIGTEMLVNLGAGNDSFLTRFTGVGTSAIVDLGDGDDLARFVLHSIASDLVVNAGSGSDSVQFGSGLIQRFTVVAGGAGPDAIAGLSGFGLYTSFQGGEGADVISFQASTFQGGVLCDQGAGFGYTELRASRADAISIIGQGSQQIGLNLVQLRRLEIGLATGNNAVNIESGAFDEIYAALGDGSDQFVIRSSAISRTCSIAPGLGFDVLVSEGNLFAHAHFQGFEVPTDIQTRTLRRVA